MAEEAEERIECPFCEKDYSTQGYLDNHIEDKHPEEVVDEEPVEAAEPDEEPSETHTEVKTHTVYEEPSDEGPPETPCANHPDREAVGSTDGAKVSVVHYCAECKRKYA